MSTLNPSPAKAFPVILASSVKVRELTWLWHPYIPSSSATLLFGPGGMGKSHITVEIASALSRGDPLPGQDTPHLPQKILMLSAEDDFDAVLVPRLIRAGANLDNVAFTAIPFTLDLKGLQQLEATMRQFAATIVFIDPIVSYMGGKVDMNRANEVREVMGGVHQMAIRTQTSIIVVGHSRKGQEGEAYEQAMGSADFNNAVRSSLHVSKDPSGQRVMRHVKANYSALGPTLAYSFDDDHFQWDGVYDDDALLTPVGKTRSRPGFTAVTFLKTILKDGPVRAKEVEAMAKDEKINMRTLARVKIGLAESFMTMEGGKPLWFWRLAGEGDDKTTVLGVDDRFGASPRGSAPADGPLEPSPPHGTSGPFLKVGSGGPSPVDPREIAKDFLRARGIDPDADENKGTWVGSLSGNKTGEPDVGI